VEKELEVLGFVFSSSILSPTSEKLGLTPLLSIKDIKRTSVLASTGGLIQSIKQVKTKSGQAMAFLVLFDETDIIECVLFPKLFTTLTKSLIKGDIIVVSGHLDKEKKGTLLLEHIKVVTS
jgi:DNA polymerase-3 subunit alpha